MKHYDIKQSSDDGTIIAMYCNYCNYTVLRHQSKKTKTGHAWPYMSHNIKRHLRDKHNINLYKKIKEKE